MTQALPPELNGKKVSDIFIEFTEPFLKKLLAEDASPSLEALNTALQIPWTIWNAVVAETISDNTVDYIGSLKLLTKGHSKAAKQMISELEQRKRLHFSQYDFLIGDFGLYEGEQHNELIFRAEARKKPGT